MRAITQSRYGLPSVLDFTEVAIPALEDDRVLVGMEASSVNALDWHMTTGTPYLVRPTAGIRTPRQPIPGTDAAGTVVAVGSEVTRLAVGDQVFGGVVGAYAEFAVARESSLAIKPESVTFEQAAAAPVAALTALQGLRDSGNLQPGERVLINGASGGVGTFAIQIAKAFGATVTAVCSTRNVEAARVLGADEVIDYTTRDYTEGEEQYDVILDVVGTGRIGHCKRVLRPGGRYVMISGPKGRWLGPIPRLLRAKLMFLRGDRTMRWVVASITAEDLEALADLMDSGQVTSLVEATYPLSEAREALNRFGEGHARAKTVITVAKD